MLSTPLALMYKKRGGRMAAIHDLIPKAKERDHRAWDELYSLVQPHLVHLAPQVIGANWASQSMSDLVQKTWLRAWEKIDQFRGGENDTETAPMFRAWLSQIMRNTFRNDRRDEDVKMVSLSSSQANLTDSQGNVDVPANDPTLSTGLMRQEVREAVNELEDPINRRIVQLYFFDDMTYEEVAKQVDLAVHQVVYRLRTLKPHLERKLKEFGNG